MKTTESLPSTAEYGSRLFKENESTFSPLATKRRAMMGTKTAEVTLYHRSPGYVPAGSCARLQARDVWGYTWNDGRANHGRMFLTLAEAKAAFDGIA